MRVAAGADRLDPLPGREAALSGETGDGEDGCGGIDHGALVDQSGELRKEPRAPGGRRRGIVVGGSHVRVTGVRGRKDLKIRPGIVPNGGAGSKGRRLGRYIPNWTRRLLVRLRLRYRAIAQSGKNFG
jgi:hypothetical protein